MTEQVSNRTFTSQANPAFEKFCEDKRVKQTPRQASKFRRKSTVLSLTAQGYTSSMLRNVFYSFTEENFKPQKQQKKRRN